MRMYRESRGSTHEDGPVALCCEEASFACVGDASVPNGTGLLSRECDHA
jgi:hypothetical protein